MCFWPKTSFLPTCSLRIREPKNDPNKKCATNRVPKKRATK